MRARKTGRRRIVLSIFDVLPFVQIHGVPRPTSIAEALKGKVMTNIERLQQAGLIEVHHPLTPEEVNSVNQLSSAEIDALISVRSKLGDDFFNRKVQVGDAHRMGTMIL
jgi:hypothetical protein